MAGNPARDQGPRPALRLGTTHLRKQVFANRHAQLVILALVSEAAGHAATFHRRSYDVESGSAQHEAWELIQRSHAVANGVFVAVTNRVGREGNLEFWGASFVADPFGRVLARASHDREEILVVRCDLGLIETTRRNWPFLRDRRIDAYDGLLRRFRD